MKTIYLDCSMGAAGDMLTAALLELTEDKETALGELNALGIPHVRYEAERCEKRGIVGTHMSVKIDGHEEGDEHAEHQHHHGRHRLPRSVKLQPSGISIYLEFFFWRGTF